MHLQHAIQTQMTALGIRRQDIAQRLGYRNITKGLRRFDAWMAGTREPAPQQRRLLSSFLEINPEELDALLARDRQLRHKKRRGKRAADPHYYLTVRLMAAVHRKRRLDVEVSQREAIALARQTARRWRKKCALNTPNNQTLWFNEDGAVYALTEEGPSMRIGGKSVSMNLI